MRSAMRLGAAGLGLAAVFAPAAGRAFVRFDFDQRYLIQPGYTIKDHTLVRAQDGTFHIFYIKADQSVPEWQTAKSLGHATSTDLIHWAFHPDVIPVVPDTWEESYIWAPHIVQRVNFSGDMLYYMYYTGVNRYYAQATGLAVSADLFNWTKYGGNPVYRPDTSWASWTDSTWSNCRDPFVFRSGSLWYMLNTASTKASQGAIALATSTNLVNWNDQGPLFVHPGPQAWHVLESASLHYVNGVHHLFFTEEGVGGTSYLQAPAVLGPWDYAKVEPFDQGHASEFTRVGSQWYLSRHWAVSFLGGPLYEIKFDPLSWTAPTKPVINASTGLDSWILVSGTAFETQPTFWDNTLARGAEPANFGGNSWIGTYELFTGPLQTGEPGEIAGDDPVGVIRSKTFVLTGNRISFRIGGGLNPDSLYLGLQTADDGALQLRAYPPGNFTETMEDRLWDVTPWIGRPVYLVIVDQASGPWGHINVEEIVEFLDPSPPTDAEAGPAPRRPRLLGNVPNPFNPATRIDFEVPAGGRTRLDVFDVRGRWLGNLVDAELAPGRHAATWEARGGTAASGVYIVRLHQSGFAPQDRRVVLVR